MRTGHWIRLALLFVALPTCCSANDYALTIGGGYSPTGNQVSLEKNTQFFQRVLDRFYPKQIQHTILFADGNNAQRDLQYRPHETGMSPARETVAHLFGQTRYLYDQYRNHEIDGVTGASSKAEFEGWISRMKKQAKPGDRILIYVTAHGGKSADKKDDHNTKLYLWNNQYITMRDFTKQLDTLPAEVPVTVVMVQCYSGGFSHLIYREGDPKKGLAPQPRCGFYATTHTRVAAGCTSDIKEEDYHEYSSYFWAALLGESRTGQPVTAADLDHDGHISFAEAHAYALQESITIDISVKTSDVLLRQYSKLGDAKHPELFSADTEFDKLAATAYPEDAYVAQQLSKQLGLTGAKRAEATRQLIKKIELEKKQLGKQIGTASSKQRQLQSALRKALQRQWPEFHNYFHPQVTVLLDHDSDNVMAFLKKQPQYKEFLTQQQIVKKQTEAKFDLDRKWVKCQRLLRCLDNMALQHNLPLVATSDQQAEVQRLISLERQTLASAAN